MSATRFNPSVKTDRASPRTVVGRRTRSVLGRAIEDLERIRIDAGVSRRRLAAAAKIDDGYLTQVVAGKRQPSFAVLVAIATALGADLNVRAFPNTGPHIHDRTQTRIEEELLRIAHPTWRRFVEVAVNRPARGFIDLVFDRSVDIVATEVHTRIDRLEQVVRWSDEKARSLPSSDMWRLDRSEPRIHKLLVLRSTVATRALAKRFEEVLRAAHPASTAEIYAALTDPDRPWPGDGILWADVDGDTVRILDRPPRGINVGR